MQLVAGGCGVLGVFDGRGTAGAGGPAGTTLTTGASSSLAGYDSLNQLKSVSGSENSACTPAASAAAVNAGQRLAPSAVRSGSSTGIREE